MLLTNRKFEREEPSLTAKSLYIFCEGAKREKKYFQYFVKMDSRVNIEVYDLDDQEDNSPLGLLNIAENSTIATKENPSPQYDFQEGDEVWIVLDRDKDKLDSRAPQLAAIRAFCQDKPAWNMVQSNPCFEVWLYYHVFDTKPIFDGDDICESWKGWVNTKIPGGFDSRKHPIFIEQAAEHSKANYSATDDEPDKGSTEVHLLAENMLSILKEKIDKVLAEVQT